MKHNGDRLLNFLEEPRSGRSGSGQFSNEALGPVGDRADFLLLNNKVHKALSLTHSPGSSPLWKALFLDDPGGSGLRASE
jgi:hypothetical protein